MSLAIFDLDGTLVDSSKVLVNSINYVRQRLHLPAMESEDIMYGITNPE
jgi:phosphoglycolate phosphatase